MYNVDLAQSVAVSQTVYDSIHEEFGASLHLPQARSVLQYSKVFGKLLDRLRPEYSEFTIRFNNVVLEKPACEGSNDLGCWESLKIFVGNVASKVKPFLGSDTAAPSGISGLIPSSSSFSHLHTSLCYNVGAPGRMS